MEAGPTAHEPKAARGPIVPAILLAVAVIGTTVGVFMAQAAQRQEGLALRALELQMIANHFGAAALAVDRKDFESALAHATRAYQRMDVRAARDGGLPRTFQDLADTRDATVAGLARADTLQGRLLTDAFFALLVPVDAAAALGDLPAAVATAEGMPPPAGPPSAPPSPPDVPDTIGR